MYDTPAEMKTDYLLMHVESDDRYLVQTGETYFAVDKLSYYILYCLKKKIAPDDIAVCLNSMLSGNPITIEKIKEILQSGKLAKILYPGAASDVSSFNYVRAKITIMKPDKMQLLLRALGLLFSEDLFPFLLVFSAICTLIIIVQYVSLRGNINFLDQHTLSVAHLLWTWLAYHLILFLHEMGHAAAAARHKLPSKSIGFGFYFVFPVFYTELTSIWRLPRSGRIQVNIGGIYFQLLINVLLLGLYFVTGGSIVTTTLMALNTVSLLASFIPFFRYDGYWILSDFLNIPNLNARSSHWLIRSLGFRRTAQRLLLPKKRQVFLGFYAVLNVFFWSWAYWRLFIYVSTAIHDILENVAAGKLNLSVCLKGCIYPILS